MSDLISRQAAIDALTALEEPAPTARHLIAIYDCEDAIKALPSAQPVRHGKWKKIRGTINCSACKSCSWSMSFEDLVSSFNYCPNCGARMISPSITMSLFSEGMAQGILKAIEKEKENEH